MKILKIAKPIAFCLIFGLILRYVYGVLSWKDTAGEYTSSMNTLYDLEENTVDVLFLGSSHCYCSIINADLWEEYGIASLGMSISGQDIASTYHCIVETLKTQKPKVICVESFGAVFSGYLIKGNLYRNTLLYQPSVNGYEAVNHTVTNAEEKADILLRWPIIHTRYKELQKEDFVSKDIPYLGYITEYKTNMVDPIVWYGVEDMVPLDEENEKWFRKILQLAEKEGIEVCFFVAPYVETEENQKKYKYLEKIAQENQTPFVNLIELADEIGIDRNRDFIDAYHTNHFGAQKVTAYMGEFLKTNYALEDRRGDSRYQLWERDVMARKHETNNALLKSTNDLKTYLDMLSTLEEYTIIIATSGDYLAGKVDFSDHLQTLGIDEAFFQDDGIWVLKNQELIYCSQEENSMYYGELPYGDVALSSAAGTKGILINRENCFKYDSSINVVVYDNMFGEVVDSVGFYALNEYGVVR